MVRNLIWICAKIVAAIIGAYAGFLAGFGLSYYLGDHGNVGSAAAAMLFVPVGLMAGTLLGWFGLRRIEKLN
jgi:hypothetical protein